MTERRKELGKWGEQRAKEYLLSLGYTFVAANWRNRFGEIDLIMLDHETVVFVEVRTKSNHHYGYGFESVHLKKQQQMQRMASAFLHSKNWWNRSIRFDVISIDKIEEVYQLKHFKNVIN